MRNSFAPERAESSRAQRRLEALIARCRGFVFEWCVIYRLSRPIIHAEVDGEFMLSLEGLLNHLQEAAISHADSAGFGTEKVRSDGTAWMLHKAGVEIRRLPKLGEHLETATWITGAAGFRARRSFGVRAGSEVVAMASYVWVYFDAVRRVPQRIDAGLNAAFQPEGGEPAVPGVDELAKFEVTSPSFEALITTRYTDFDSNDHVNNSIYANFVQTLLHQRGETQPVGRMTISFLREIGRGVAALTGRLEDTADGCRFSLSSPGILHACGEIGWRG